MRDGFYLSTYLHIGELAHMSEIVFRHDQNISLWKKNGDHLELVHYWELERITGFKEHERSFYNAAHAQAFINELLKEHNLSLDDMAEIWGTPGLQTGSDYHSLDDYPELEYHNVAHLFSSLLFDTELFENNTMIGLAVDGGPDKVLDMENMRKFYAGCVVRNGKIVDVFPISSPGFLWMQAKYCFDMKEGTLMALAGACKSELYLPEEEAIPIEDFDTTFLSSGIRDYIRRLIVTVQSLSEKDVGIRFSGYDPKFSIRDNHISMIMKEIQRMSYKIIERELDRIIGKYDVNPRDAYLALSGGYALNCPTNSRLMSKYGFKGFVAPPCVNDGGLSLGMALYAFYKRNKRINFNMRHAYYGDRDENTARVLDDKNYSPFIKNISGIDFEQAVKDIEEYPIVWFNGFAEIGPRALGNRSIIADPRKEASKDILNEVKQRQWWRPVAPVVLEEAVGEWFEGAYPSPFMLHTFRIRDSRLDSIPAVSHIDRSARVQTVNEKDNPLLYALIKSFGLKTGVPILCNTSLNDRGEPIINRIEEALNFALRKGIKIAYINGQRVELLNHSAFPSKQPETRPRQSAVEYFGAEEKKARLKELNPFDLSRLVLGTYAYHKELTDNFDIRKEKDIQPLLRMVRMIDKRQISFDDLKL